MATFAMFLAFFWVNRGLPGMPLMFGGWFLNLFPIITNAGKMPVSVWGAKIAGTAIPKAPTYRHLPMSSSTHFNFLGDWIPIPSPRLICNVISPGDVLLAIGLFWLIQATMCPRKKHVEEAGEES
jgi:hypothetical protein